MSCPSSPPSSLILILILLLLLLLLILIPLLLLILFLLLLILLLILILLLLLLLILILILILFLILILILISFLLLLLIIIILLLLLLLLSSPPKMNILTYAEHWKEVLLCSVFGCVTVFYLLNDLRSCYPPGPTYIFLQVFATPYKVPFQLTKCNLYRSINFTIL